MHTKIRGDVRRTRTKGKSKKKRPLSDILSFSFFLFFNRPMNDEDERTTTISIRFEYVSRSNHIEQKRNEIMEIFLLLFGYLKDDRICFFGGHKNLRHERFGIDSQHIRVLSGRTHKIDYLFNFTTQKKEKEKKG